MKKLKKRIKTNLELVQLTRKEWIINPRTRIQENEKLNKKKLRQEGKKICKT